jgi:hypothetical protein
MCIEIAANAAWFARTVRAALLILAVGSVESSRPVAAALSSPLARESARAEISNPLHVADPGLPPLRIAQSSGGFFEGLFSVFKPNKPNVESPPTQIRNRRSISGSLTGNDEAGLPETIRPSVANPRSYASYRTMCVRLCDGYYWPVNSGMQSSSIVRDQDTCEQSCQSDTKLYIQYSLAADAGDMRDLSGKPYRKLKTAFLYRKTYDPNCKCKPDPWSKPELLRHEEYRTAESGGTIGEPLAIAIGSDAAETEEAVIRDTLASEAETSTDLDLITADGSSAATEPVPETAMAETPAVTRNAPQSRPKAGSVSVTKPRKTSLPKSAAPFLAPADTVARAKK